MNFSIVDRAGSPIKETVMKRFKRTRTTRIAGRLGIYGRFPRKRYFLR